MENMDWKDPYSENIKCTIQKRSIDSVYNYEATQ